MAISGRMLSYDLNDIIKAKSTRKDKWTTKQLQHIYLIILNLKDYSIEDVLFVRFKLWGPCKDIYVAVSVKLLIYSGM